MPWPVGIPRTLNAEQRSERARHASLARTTTDYFISHLANRTLTEEQRRRLADVVIAATPTHDEAS